MHEFVFASWSRRRETAEQIHHATCDEGADPDIAVYDPQYIPFGFPVCSAHIPNFRIRSQISSPPFSTGEIRILLFHHDPDIKVMVVGYKPLEDGESGIAAG